MKKFLSAIFVLGILAGLSGLVYAGGPEDDFGYITVRCTATVSVNIYPGDTPDTNSESAPGSQLLVTSPTYAGAPAVVLGSATVKNDSTGAICIWKLKFAQIFNVDRNEEEWPTGTYNFKWQPDDTTLNAGVLKVSLAGLFQSTAPAVSAFQTNDLFTATLTPWKRATNDNFEPNDECDYEDTSPLGGITAAEEHLTAPGDTRGLWFYLKVPTGVGDENTRRLVIQVVAALAGS